MNRLLSIISIVAFLTIFLTLALAGFTCSDSGRCMYCDRSEMKEDYCKETGKKIMQVCMSDNKTSKITDYRSCTKTNSDDQFQVMMFQFVMAVVGGIAFWGVQTRKQSQMTLFENRKQSMRAQRV